MGIMIAASGQACGAEVTGVDLSKPLDEKTVQSIRTAWLEHHVLSFPEQLMSDDDLERFTNYFGPFGDDPFILPIAGREHVIAIQRNADETSSLFAEAWHTDWSFQTNPPSGTCLYGITIPPVGGDTLFANQHKALADMPAQLRAKIEGKLAIHSAAGAYSPEGAYGETDQDSGRSMLIKADDEAKETHKHPLIKAHPESGQECLYSCLGYIVGIDGLDQEQATELLAEIYAWQTSPNFQYCHQWKKNNLVMWDNRSVLHRATGGYEGYDRLLHRTTIGSVA
ncbi:alpha-ketoglutarate-dependent taurine dioxygenase [marine gamma proteobacterium HTCC2143]|jgi:taurine dioxygenase|uniref:Alpha-ketoglutarate-dependent taurine dioxygenase n=1 Tax=marine gamma proteobacterium HTCC2143 TaxID=247633 RepID=A0YAM4_9GAMM|nr:alpha-ketoglutarate-dependent taurine dioxygenase [marine gamma proteobacterium HTCC2143]